MRQICFDSVLKPVLRLNDELLEMTGAELVSLLLVKIDICDLHFRPQVTGGDTHSRLGMTDSHVRAGDDDQLLKLFELDIELDSVVCEGREGKGRPRREGEVKRQRDVQVTFLPGIAYELAASVAASCEFRESSTRLTRELLPAEKEGGPELIDLLTSDDELGLCEQEMSYIIAVMAPRVTEFGAHGVGTV